MVHEIKLAQIVSQLIYKWFHVGSYIYIYINCDL